MPAHVRRDATPLERMLADRMRGVSASISGLTIRRFSTASSHVVANALIELITNPATPHEDIAGLVTALAQFNGDPRAETAEIAAELRTEALLAAADAACTPAAR